MIKVFVTRKASNLFDSGSWSGTYQILDGNEWSRRRRFFPKIPPAFAVDSNRLSLLVFPVYPVAMLSAPPTDQLAEGSPTIGAIPVAGVGRRRSRSGRPHISVPRNCAASVPPSRYDGMVNLLLLW